MATQEVSKKKDKEQDKRRKGEDKEELKKKG
jgi:hypothetical protein